LADLTSLPASGTGRCGAPGARPRRFPTAGLCRCPSWRRPQPQAWPLAWVLRASWPPAPSWAWPSSSEWQRLRPRPCGDALPDRRHGPLLLRHGPWTRRRPFRGLQPGQRRAQPASAASRVASLLLRGLGLLFWLLGQRRRRRALRLRARAARGSSRSALFRQLFFLAADQLSLAAGFFLAAGQFGPRRCAADTGAAWATSGSGDSQHGLNAFIALDEGALLAHFHLDGAGLARGIGLLDLAGGLLHQRDLLAIGRSRAVAGLQVGQQLLLVGLGEGIGRGSLGPRLQLLSCSSRVSVDFLSSVANSATVLLDIFGSCLPDLTLALRTSVRAPS
jgi:hypothetical protein